jgi:phosphatidylglycerophosphate synthase
MESNLEATQQLNIYQRVANRTHNVLTVENALDAVSVPMAAWGLPRLETWAGILASMAAFEIDNVDGYFARRNGTASSLGEMVDATTDKIRLGLAVGFMWRDSPRLRPLIAAIGAQNSYNAGLTLLDRKNNQDPSIHPSQFGKKAIFMQQWGLGVNVIGAKIEKSNLQAGKAVKTAGNILGWAGVGVGIAASVGYTRKYVESQRIKNNQQQTASAV